MTPMCSRSSSVSRAGWRDQGPAIPMDLLLAVARPAARFRILRPHAKGGLGEVFVAARRGAASRGGPQADQGAPCRRSREPVPLPAGGRDHRRTGASGHRAGLRLGHYADGRPFYAMRFIKGDSLKEAIERFHGAETSCRDSGRADVELHKLLRRFLDVCNAIAYAHSRGVLHRDIKPGNIMLGQYGETLVVDWGLAKVVGSRERRSAEATLRPPSASGSSETLPGSAIGTPAFMSPEQAAGRLDQLGPASDVYSLGATLYCLLTGKAPIEGPDSGRSLTRAARRFSAAPTGRSGHTARRWRRSV